jgi:CheY-like chemotaxis protein
MSTRRSAGARRDPRDHPASRQRRGGLDLACAKRPDLAIIATGLRDEDGYELTRSLRAEPGLEHVPILILSGYFAGEHAARLPLRGGRLTDSTDSV